MKGDAVRSCRKNKQQIYILLFLNFFFTLAGSNCCCAK